MHRCPLQVEAPVATVTAIARVCLCVRVPQNGVPMAYDLEVPMARCSLVPEAPLPQVVVFAFFALGRQMCQF